MKCQVPRDGKKAATSRPVWGAWIEIAANGAPVWQNFMSRAPYGARGLKYDMMEGGMNLENVAPRMGRVD